LELEVKEKSKDMRQLLNKLHRHQGNSCDSALNIMNDETQDSDQSLNRDELVSLLATLENCKQDQFDLDRLLSGQSARIQTAVQQLFQEEHQQAELQDYIIKAWSPWWRAELTTGLGDKDDVNDDFEDEMKSYARPGRTLDERILKTTPLSSLKTTVAPLQYNLIEILYGTVWMLRLYHGVENAYDMAQEASDTLLLASTVLSEDARYFSLHSVLAECTRKSTEYYEGDRSNCNTPWNVLAQDVVCICSNYRLAIRALFDACDVVRVSLNKCQLVKQEAEREVRRRVRKKLKFFLAWVLANKYVLQSVASDANAWTVDWDLESKIDFQTRDTLLLPGKALAENPNRQHAQTSLSAVHMNGISSQSSGNSDSEIAN
jgi:hypothetical protein